jgi:selenocysteine lyase/cysteine desulfurase
LIQFELVPHAGRYEGGALNLPGISALGASLELFEEVGPAQVTEQILQLTDYLCQAAPHAGLTVYSPRTPRSAASGVVSLIPTNPGIDPVAIQKACRAAGIMINVRVGRLRVSPHFYNTTAEIDRFLGVARSIQAAI